MKAEGGHWYRIRFLGSTLESPLEQARMLEVISAAMAGRARRAAAKRAAGGGVTVRPARIYAHREDGSLSGTWTTAPSRCTGWWAASVSRTPTSMRSLTWMGCAVS